MIENTKIEYEAQGKIYEISYNRFKDSYDVFYRPSHLGIGYIRGFGYGSIEEAKKSIDEKIVYED